MSRLTFYAHPGCSTCTAARDWLTRRGVAFIEKDIRAEPPAVAQLRAVLAANDGKLTRISNTSGIEYRAQKLSARLPGLSTEAALQLLASNGMFVKRPVLVGPGVALAGFKEPAWTAALASV